MKKLIEILKEVIIWFVKVISWIIACYIFVFIEFGRNVADFTVGNIIMTSILFVGFGTGLILYPKKGVKKISKIRYILAILFLICTVGGLLLFEFIGLSLSYGFF